MVIVEVSLIIMGNCHLDLVAKRGPHSRVRICYKQPQGIVCSQGLLTYRFFLPVESPPFICVTAPRNPEGLITTTSLTLVDEST